MKLLLAAALIAAALPALAENRYFSSSVSVTGMRYELIDLRPDDGIAPQVQFLGDLGAFTGIEMRNRFGSREVTDSTTDQFGAAFASAMMQGGGAFAAAKWGTNGLSLSAQGHGSKIGNKVNGVLTSFDVKAQAFGYGLQVMLSPGTEMRWTGSFEAQAMADRWWGTAATQSAGAQLQVYFGAADDSTPTFLTYLASAFANPRLGAQSDREAGAFTFSHVNDSTEWGQYRAAVLGSAVGGTRLTPQIAGVSPIPEPSTYALMAAGLSAVCFVARRRRTAAG